MRTAVLALCAILLGGSAAAVTSIPPNAPELRPGALQGVVELQTVTQLKVDGKLYLLSLPAPRYFDRNGRAQDYVRLAPGTRIAFELGEGGAGQRVTTVWIL